MSRRIEAAGSYNPNDFNPKRPERTAESADPLKRLIERGEVWWGTDLLCTQGAVILPGQTTIVELQIPNSGLPPGQISEENLRKLVRDVFFLSIRSRYAQLGLTADSKVRRVINSQQQQKTVRLGIKGLGGRPVELSQGEGLGCFFTPIGGNCLQGEELFNTASRIFRTVNDKFRINTKFGRDWLLVIPKFRSYASTRTEYAGEATAIALRLGRKRLMIPRSDESVSLSGITDYRGYLDRYVFKSVGPKTKLPDFWIGETKVPVCLLQEEGIVGILESTAYENGRWIVQTDSRLMKPGQTDWALRGEFKQHGMSESKVTGLRGQGTRFLVMQLFQQP